jgi:hypothetical protein
MIVRISGEDQYRLADSDAEELKRREDAVAAIVESGREDGFAEAYGALLGFVRTSGTPIADDEIETSDHILGPPDLTFQEASTEFTGEGLIPD